MTTTHVGPAILRTIDSLSGPAGHLEALLNEGTADAPFAVLACHPHPLGGGTLHNKVVFHAMKAFQAFGLPVLRFNFRGTGLSSGSHDGGRGEQDDVRAALDWLDREYRRPLLFTGFSFGANVGLHACCGDPRVLGLAALGLPIHAEGRDYDYEFLAACPQSKLFVSGTRDQFGPVPLVEKAVNLALPPSKMVWIDGADHFFAGKLDQVRTAIRNWAQNQFPSLKSK
jgi:hypothetical protein